MTYNVLLKPYQLLRPGRLDYETSARWQQELVRARQADHIPDTLALLAHPPVYVYGRSGRRQRILLTDQQLRELGLKVVAAEHGGGTQFFGPGQLVAYLVVSLELWGGDAIRFVRLLEESLIRTLGSFGISARRPALGAGVMVDGARVAAIGIKVARGVTSHGLALDVNTDLSCYDPIIPATGPVTSMARLLGHEVAVPRVTAALIRQLEETLGYAPGEAHPVAHEETMRFDGTF